jgi:hypothetical protein
VTYGGDSGNRIFVLYWRCPLIRVSVIRGSTIYINPLVYMCVFMWLCFKEGSSRSFTWTYRHILIYSMQQRSS